jgi:phage gpG-like protein
MARPAPIKIEVDYAEMRRQFDKFANRSTFYMSIAILKSMQHIGMIAVQNHMVAAHTVNGNPGVTIGTFGDKLNIRTGRLARSLTDSYNFNNSATDGGGNKDSIRKIRVSHGQVMGTFGSSVEYAYQHEHGIGVRKRPYLNPALNESKEQINNIFEKQMELLTQDASD